MDIKLRLIFGFIVIFTVITFWSVVIIPSISYSFDEYSLVVEQRGMDQIVPSYGADLSEPFLIEEITRQNIISQDDDFVKIDLNLVATNLETSEVVFVLSEILSINKLTQMYEDETKGLFSFPNNVQKQDYVVSIPFTSFSAPFIFQQSEKVLDLDTYQFSCERKNIDARESYPQFTPHDIFIDYKCNVWIEPKTGDVIKFRLNWDAYFVEDGERTLQAEIGGKEITDASTAILVDEAKKHKQLLFIYEIIVPIILGILGTIIMIIIMQFQKINAQNKLILQTRDELIKKERLSSIGELASRMAHDIRNPLSTIKISNALLKKQYGVEEGNRELFESTDRSVNRISHQIDRVLGFVKGQNIHSSKVKFSEVISESLDSLMIPSTTKLILPKNDFELLCDKKLLAIALNNLILNGIQAIDGTGTVEITVEEDDGGIIIQVKDSGIGIPKEHLDKIFEPLFTTKMNGIGLGLASVKSIIDAHGGVVSVTSPPTIFTITLQKVND